jgi:hypothetical protein
LAASEEVGEVGNGPSDGENINLIDRYIAASLEIFCFNCAT